jgi:hypothetical protein
MAGGMVNLVLLGPKAPGGLLLDVAADGASAILVLVAMGFGLIVPRMGIEHVRQSLAQSRARP